MKQFKYLGTFGKTTFEVYAFNYTNAFYLLMAKAIQNGLDTSLLEEIVNSEYNQSYQVNKNNKPLADRKS